jgi:hypothetical protein
MLVRESTLRRIIREEARRVLGEDDDVMIPIATAPVGQVSLDAPAATPATKAPAPAGAEAVDPQTMIKNLITKSYNQTIMNVWNPVLKQSPDVQQSVTISFKVVPDGSIDQGSVKVALVDVPGKNPPAPAAKTKLQADITTVVKGWKFYPVAAPTDYSFKLTLKPPSY